MLADAKRLARRWTGATARDRRRLLQSIDTSEKGRRLLANLEAALAAGKSTTSMLDMVDFERTNITNANLQKALAVVARRNDARWQDLSNPNAFVINLYRRQQRGANKRALLDMIQERRQHGSLNNVHLGKAMIVASRAGADRGELPAKRLLQFQSLVDSAANTSAKRNLDAKLREFDELYKFAIDDPVLTLNHLRKIASLRLDLARKVRDAGAIKKAGGAPRDVLQTLNERHRPLRRLSSNNLQAQFARALNALTASRAKQIDGQASRFKQINEELKVRATLDAIRPYLNEVRATPGKRATLENLVRHPAFGEGKRYRNGLPGLPAWLEDYIRIYLQVQTGDETPASTDMFTVTLRGSSRSPSASTTTRRQASRSPSASTTRRRASKSPPASSRPRAVPTPAFFLPVD